MTITVVHENRICIIKIGFQFYYKVGSYIDYREYSLLNFSQEWRAKQPNQDQEKFHSSIATICIAYICYT